MGYLNINCLRDKISGLRILLHNLQLEYFVISETKVDTVFHLLNIQLKTTKLGKEETEMSTGEV